MYRYRFNIEYDGSLFCGWQKQVQMKTVQGDIEKAIFNLTQSSVNICGAGRTDAGVHAIGQVAHFDMEKKIEDHVLNRGLNFYLKNSGISIYDSECLGENSSFHARFSAKQRIYMYKIINRDYPLTFQNRTIWHVHKKLNVEKMQQGANLLIGTHDFSTFRAANCQAKSSIKTIDSIDINVNGDGILNVFVAAPSFLYHQVRNIVGALYFVGCGKWSIDDFIEAFLSKDRTRGAITAPACGLYFYKVKY